MGTYDIGGGAAAGAQASAQGIGNVFKALAAAPMVAQQAEQNQALLLAKIFANQQSGSKHEQEAIGLKMTNDLRSSIDAELAANPNMPAYERATRIAFKNAGPQFMDNWSRSNQIQQKVSDIEAIKSNPLLATPTSQAYFATSGGAPYDNVGNTGASINRLTGAQIQGNGAMLGDHLNGGGNIKLNENQGNALIYGARAKMASGAIDNLNGDYSPAVVNTKLYADDIPVVGGLIGSGANMLMGEKDQIAEQSQRNFINAVLRRESGASISKSEFDNAKKQYLPQPGDSQEVLAQKRANRELVIDGLTVIAGPAGSKVKQLSDKAAQTASETAINRLAILKQAKEAVARGADRAAVVSELRSKYGIESAGF